MEVIIRKPYEGVINIFRFNWHFYAGAGAIILLLFISIIIFPEGRLISSLLISLIICTTFISLVISHYVYDRSDLYKLKWLNFLKVQEAFQLINVHVGFDETSLLLSAKYPKCKLDVFDFYNSEKHTEVSIARARKAYPAYLPTKKISTAFIPSTTNSADVIFIILAVHEIRNRKERILFFEELKRILKQNGNIVVVEHLRDAPNFFAYNLGCLHFFSKKEWRHTFISAGLRLKEEMKITPFISVFILEQHGTAS